MHITRCYQSAEPFVKLIGHYAHAFELITKYKQHSQCTFSFSDNVNGWSAAASGTFAARCPATLCMPSPGHAKSGIPGRDRACSLWFWRPALYQLSYGNISCCVQSGLAATSKTLRSYQTKLLSCLLFFFQPQLCNFKIFCIAFNANKLPAFPDTSNARRTAAHAAIKNFFSRICVCAN